MTKPVTPSMSAEEQDARKALKCLYLEVPESVASAVEQKVFAAFSQFQSTESEVKELPGLDKVNEHLDFQGFHKHGPRRDWFIEGTEWFRREAALILKSYIADNAYKDKLLKEAKDDLAAERADHKNLETKASKLFEQLKEAEENLTTSTNEYEMMERRCLDQINRVNDKLQLAEKERDEASLELGILTNIEQQQRWELNDLRDRYESQVNGCSELQKESQAKISDLSARLQNSERDLKASESICKQLAEHVEIITKERGEARLEVERAWKAYENLNAAMLLRIQEQTGQIADLSARLKEAESNLEVSLNQSRSDAVTIGQLQQAAEGLVDELENAIISIILIQNEIKDETIVLQLQSLAESIKEALSEYNKLIEKKPEEKGYNPGLNLGFDNPPL